MVDILCGPLLEKQTDFSFLSRYQFQIISFLRIELVSISPSQEWDFARFEPVQILCFLVPVSVISEHNNPVVCERHYFPYTTAGTYNLPTSSLEDSRALGEGFRKTSHL